VTPLAWTVGAVAYPVVTCLVYVTLCYLDGARGGDADSRSGNLAPAILWPLTLAIVVVFAAVGVVWRVVLKLVVEPVRRLGSRAREAGERQRDRVVRGGR